MAHHKSAIRQERRSLRRKAVNTRNTSALRTSVRKVREAVESGDAEAARKLLPQVFSSIDQAVKKGAIHKNTGSRYKSRLNKQVAGMAVSPAK
jgi:small subunit ribosomal protein S20